MGGIAGTAAYDNVLPVSQARQNTLLVDPTADHHVPLCFSLQNSQCPREDSSPKEQPVNHPNQRSTSNFTEGIDYQAFDCKANPCSLDVVAAAMQNVKVMLQTIAMSSQQLSCEGDDPDP